MDGVEWLPRIPRSNSSLPLSKFTDAFLLSEAATLQLLSQHLAVPQVFGFGIGDDDHPLFILQERLIGAPSFEYTAMVEDPSLHALIVGQVAESFIAL